MKYRRAKVAGGTYFFTVVTHNRRPFLCEPENIDLLRDAFRYVKNSQPFIIDVIAILPEHILVRSPKDWQFSSFHHHVRQGVYTLDWGS